MKKVDRLEDYVDRLSASGAKYALRVIIRTLDNVGGSGNLSLENMEYLLARTLVDRS